MSRFVIGFALLVTSSSFAAEPKVLDDRLKLELFAEQPQIVTPTGIDVDHLGRVWAIESHTHFPPEGYKGHPTDRVLILEDTNSDGKADKITPFADGLTHAMSVVVQPIWLGRVDGLELKVDGQDKPASAGHQPSTINHQPTVFLATRKEILLLRDTDGDLKADERTTLVRLDTPGNYPHNGLAGIAFDALGWMFFGFGENLGADYKLIGSDGITLSGGGEGGNIYRCRPDGSKLEQWATGFWNPHASCFDAFGRLFTVDNDPDSRPPCRLLHIIPGGDYGYRFRNGRKGTHPFTSWNGELPGTLPMVSGTGEAPSGILCYESDGFPNDYLGTLLVGTWGDHRIDQFVLEPKGASFVSKPKPIVQGDETFRPVGLALAPDGSVYFTDWVLRDYKLHGKGRVWRLSAKQPPMRTVIDVTKIELADGQPLDSLTVFLNSLRKDVRRTALSKALSHLDFQEWIEKRARENKIPASAYEDAARHLYPQRQPSEMPADIRRETLGVYVLQGDDPVSLNGAVRTLTSLALTTAALHQWWEDIERKLHGDDNPAGYARLSLVFAISARQTHPHDRSLSAYALRNPKVAIRRFAVQWIGEELLTELRPGVEALLTDPQTTPELFLTCLASLSLLDGVPAAEFEKTPPTKYLLPMLTDRSKPAALRATALRLLPPATPELPTPLLIDLLKSDDATLSIEAVRTLALAPRKEAVVSLLDIATNPQANLDLRCEAILALSAVGADHPEWSRIGAIFLDGIENRLAARDPKDRETLQAEAMRAVRSRGNDASFREPLERIRDTKGLDVMVRSAAALSLSGQLGPYGMLDYRRRPPEAGWRVFFSPHGPQCAKCHTVHGRGGQVGPDLSVIARTMDRAKLIDSIVNPSKEVSPQYLTWVITTTGGKTHTGIIVSENGGGDVELGDAQGNVIKVPRKDIDERTPSPVSVMPQGLHQRMTPREFAEVISYLETLK